jgi:hypothetical protein
MSFLVVGSWFLVVGSWLLALGCWLLVVGSWLLALGCWLLVVGSWLLIFRILTENQQPRTNNQELFYDYDFRPFVFQIEADGFEARVYLALHGFVHRFAFDRGVLPFQLLDFFLQQLYATYASFGEMGIGDVDDAQKAEEHDVRKVAEHEVGRVLADVECLKEFVCHDFFLKNTANTENPDSADFTFFGVGRVRTYLPAKKSSADFCTSLYFSRKSVSGVLLT